MIAIGGEGTRGSAAGDDTRDTGALAMAGRNPWGGGSDESGDSDNAGASAGDHGAHSGENGTSGSGTGPDSGESKGPRNPWLPSGETPPPPRRPAGLDDILRNRGGGNGGRGPGGPSFPNFPQRSNGKSWVPTAIGLAVVALLGMSSVHMLGPKEQGVVTRLGQYSRTIDSGVSLTLPWPIEQVQIADVRSFTVDMIPDNENEKLMLTNDRSLVDLSYLVRWNIKDLKNYTFRLADPKETVREVAEAAMRASIAQISLNDALSGSGRATVEQDVRERMQRVLDSYRSGISIQGVEIKKADPPAKTKSAFDQVNVAQQEAERDRSEARAWAQQLIARAEGDATAFDKVYEQYKLAPEVTKRRMYYETMERVVRDNDTVVAEKGVTTYLPLPQLQRPDAKAAAPAPAPAAPNGDASAATGGQ